MGACTIPGNFFIVQEFLFKGDVEKLLRKRDVELSLYFRMRWAMDAALGMNWLHQSNPVFIHRDLKTSNLLIDEFDRVKVCDFGLSEIKQQGQMLQDTDSAKGTPLWMAPEVMMFQKFNEKADVYSFGIILWELLTREIPFKHHTNFEKFKRAVCYQHDRPVIPENTEESLKTLITRCWHRNPNQRPAFVEIIPELELVLIEVAINDPFGRKFWKENLLSIEEVEIGVFESKFLKFLKIPDIEDIPEDKLEDIERNRLCLAEVFAAPSRRGQTDNKAYVHIETFGRMLNWFGPIGDPEAVAWDITILDGIRKTLENKWFHGDVTTQQAVTLLNGQPDKTFLIRFSSIDGFYTVSIINGRKILHMRIKHTPGQPYIIDGDEFASLQDLVAEKNYTLPCPGHKYNHIFDPPNDGYGYLNFQ